MSHLRLFFFGSGKFAKNYFKIIQNELSDKFKIVAVISDNKKIDYQLTIFKNLSVAIKEIGIPDAFICCTDPKKNLPILKQIIQFNKPILIEKPVCLPDDFNHFINLINKFPNQIICVNHFHFFDINFIKIIKSLESSKQFELRVIDGDKGPRRNYSPILDWGVHTFGIISYLLNNIENIKINKIKILNRINQNEFNLYLSISDLENKKVFKVLTGNNFNYKVRNIKITNNLSTKNYDPYQKKIKSSLFNLLNSFYSSINNKNYNYGFETKEISINSMKLYLMINAKLKDNF